MPPRCFVHVLKSGGVSPHHYVGVTSAVARRLEWHNDGRSAHTAKDRPWQRHVVIEFTDEAHAAPFERYLKSGSLQAFARRHFD